MKTLVVANQKGGVGKSTLTVHLAWYAAELGARVLIIDLDSQGNSSSTLQEYACDVDASELFLEAAPGSVPANQVVLIKGDTKLVDVDRLPAAIAGHFTKHVAALRSQFDLCIIDTAPAAGLRQVAALIAANYVVSPIELETYSIQGITSMMQTIYGVKQRFNKSLTFLGMLPSRFNSHSPSQKSALAEILKAYPKLVFPLAIGLRTSIADAVTDRVPVWRVSKTAAREAGREMKAALAAIVENMGGLNHGH